MSKINPNSESNLEIKNISSENLLEIPQNSPNIDQNLGQITKLDNKTEEKLFWTDSYCITRWNKPENEILIWKKLSLEETLANLQTIGNFILDKKLWLKMYLEMLKKLQDRTQNKLTKDIDLTTQNGEKDKNLNNLQNKSENVFENEFGDETRVKILQKVLEKLLNLENFEQNWKEVLKKDLVIEFGNMSSKNNKDLQIEFVNNGKNDIKNDLSTFSKLHELVLLEFWNTGNLEFWATICGQFWEEKIKNYLAENNKKVGDYLWPLRVGLSGQKQSPSPFEILACLDYQETQKRIEICTTLV